MRKTLRVARLTNAEGHRGILPDFKTSSAACFDLAIPMTVNIKSFCCNKIPLLLAFDIPKGYCLKIYGRSSTFTSHGFVVPTSIIDSDYKKGVHGFIYNTQESIKIIAGTRLFQGMLVKCVVTDLVEVLEIKPTERGGLGSTGI